jgi:hypothetical protein
MPEVSDQPRIFDKVNLEYSIVTPPRVGSFYLQDRILQHTGVYIKKYHSAKNNKMITIARDPIDMVTSKIAMTAFYEKNNETFDDIRNNKITKDVQEYFDAVDKIDVSKGFHTIIDYEDLMIYPLETTIALADAMNIPIITKDYKENTIKGYPEYSHLVSSKVSPEYEEIKEYVEQLDLSRLYQFYYEAIARCIKPR